MLKQQQFYDAIDGIVSNTKFNGKDLLGFSVKCIKLQYLIMEALSILNLMMASHRFSDNNTVTGAVTLADTILSELLLILVIQQQLWQHSKQDKQSHSLHQ